MNNCQCISNINDYFFNKTTPFYVLGIKEYSDWPTIPQMYLNKEFVGGCDILMSMHQNGELSKLLEENGVLIPAEEDNEADQK